MAKEEKTIYVYDHFTGNAPVLLGKLIIPELSEPPVRTLGATIPENESRLFR